MSVTRPPRRLAGGRVFDAWIEPETAGTTKTNTPEYQHAASGASVRKHAADEARETVDGVYRSDSRRVFATLVRLLGDFDPPKRRCTTPFALRWRQWPRDGVPASPRAWLVSTGRFKAIDGIRRRTRFGLPLPEVVEPGDAAERDDEGDDRHDAVPAEPAADPIDPADRDDEGIEDDRLRLIFTCCHPALPPAAQVALTLREVCGLTTEEIAHAFLTAAPALAQRIVRAKAKIRDARIPYQVPTTVPERLDAVLRVIYLVFNEGYSASSGASLTRHDLSGEAIRLGSLLVELLPKEPEAMGLLALMLRQESRRTARTSPCGDLVLLDEQDRSLWNREQIAQGSALAQQALSSRGWSLHAAVRDCSGACQRTRPCRDELGPDRWAV